MRCFPAPGHLNATDSTSIRPFHSDSYFQSSPHKLSPFSRRIRLSLTSCMNLSKTGSIFFQTIIHVCQYFGARIKDDLLQSVRALGWLTNLFFFNASRVLGVSSFDHSVWSLSMILQIHPSADKCSVSEANIRVKALCAK